MVITQQDASTTSPEEESSYSYDSYFGEVVEVNNNNNNNNNDDDSESTTYDAPPNTSDEDNYYTEEEYDSAGDDEDDEDDEDEDDDEERHRGGGRSEEFDSEDFDSEDDGSSSSSSSSSSLSSSSSSSSSSECPSTYLRDVEAFVGENNTNKDDVFRNEDDPEQAKGDGGGSMTDRRKKTIAIGLAALCGFLLVLAIGLGVGLAKKGTATATTGVSPNVQSPAQSPVRMPVALPPNTDDETSESSVTIGETANSLADTTVYRDGILRESTHGNEPTMLVQRGPPGDSETPSAYALVEFELDADTLKALRDERSSSQTATLCLDHVVVVEDDDNDNDNDNDNKNDNDNNNNNDNNEESRLDDGAVRYATCVVVVATAAAASVGTGVAVDELTGGTSGLVMPDDCFGQRFVNFDVRPTDTEVCLDVSPLLFGSSSSSLENNRRILRGGSGGSGGGDDDDGTRRELLPAGGEDESSGSNNSIVLMIESVEVSDRAGDRFYTSNNNSPGTAPRLVVEGNVPQDLAPECPSIYDTICSDNDFSMLCNLIGYAGLVRMLRSNSDITIFAPNNGAVNKIIFDANATTNKTSNSNSYSDAISDLLLYHIVGSRVVSRDMACGASLVMANDRSVALRCGGGGGGGGGGPTNNDTTLFVAGDGNSDNALPAITDVDRFACNGILHTVDEVILPAEKIDGIAREKEKPDCKTFVELACSRDDLSALCQLSTLIGMLPGGNELLDDLNSGTYTIFAPNNEAALDLLGIDTSDPSRIVDVLLYHALRNATVASGDLECGKTWTMANGMETTTECSSSGSGNNETVFLVGGGNANTNTNTNTGKLPEIVEVDIPMCSGVVHVIDTILLPPGIPPSPSCASIEDVVCTNADLSLFCGLIGDSYDRFGPNLTVFAPTNEAIDAILDGMNTTDNNSKMDLVSYHAVSGLVIETGDINCSASPTPLEMANGETVEIECTDDEFYIVGDGNVADALPKITAANIETCKGVIHIVDNVILPEEEEEEEEGDATNGECQTFEEIVCSRDDLSRVCANTKLIRGGFGGKAIMNRLNNEVTTIFVPTNDGLNVIAGSEYYLDVELFGDLLFFHGILDETLLLATDFTCDQSYFMADGGEGGPTRTRCENPSEEVTTYFQVGEGNTANLPEIIETDIMTCSGVMHIVNNVILPRGVQVTNPPTFTPTIMSTSSQSSESSGLNETTPEIDEGKTSAPSDQLSSGPSPIESDGVIENPPETNAEDPSTPSDQLTGGSVSSDSDRVIDSPPGTNAEEPSAPSDEQIGGSVSTDSDGVIDSPPGTNAEEPSAPSDEQISGSVSTDSDGVIDSPPGNEEETVAPSDQGSTSSSSGGETESPQGNESPTSAPTIDSLSTESNGEIESQPGNEEKTVAPSDAATSDMSSVSSK